VARSHYKMMLVPGVVVVMGLAGCTQTGALSALSSKRPALEPNGIGSVYFGRSKVKAVAALRALLGKPNATGVNTACGPAFTEVAWHDLIAEFRHGTFTGYRYVRGGYPLTTPGSARDRVSATSRTPALATARGLTLGSTLREVRAAYPGLIQSGALKWKVPNGLVFVEASDTGKPAAATATIAEIKAGTCGDF
jgi:stage V sporulation protein SpoVS